MSNPAGILMLDNNRYFKYPNNQSTLDSCIENVKNISSKCFLNNNIIQVEFDKKPFILYDEKQIPLFNLHMHNKAAIDKFLV
jgi:hypothetical protein